MIMRRFYPSLFILIKKGELALKSLILIIEGKEKKFITPFVSGLVWRKYIELQESVENLNHLKVEELDQFVAIAVTAFNNQFTLEQFYDGLSHDKVLWTVQALFNPSEKDLGNEKTEKK